ncbi:hypothetical protein MPL3356_340074 [Mesorhizobium plurifarium]|uniref:Transposase n=1 Tax=Mesorhizobium plurifarium TaxID=69974 RepID=A0A090E1F5_MESPL|nr:hypothetical protein MPL3356_340074 [Mesorhizobium plurifarium]
MSRRVAPYPLIERFTTRLPQDGLWAGSAQYDPPSAAEPPPDWAQVQPRRFASRLAWPPQAPRTSLLQSRRHDVEISIRGVLRGFGLGPTTLKTFERRVRELVAHNGTLQQIAEALLKTGAVLPCEFKTIEKRLVGLARRDAQVRNLMSVRGLSSTFSAAIDDLSRLRSCRTVGAHSQGRPSQPKVWPRPRRPVYAV